MSEVPEVAGDDRRKRREFFNTGPLRAAHALHKALPMDEGGYRFVVGHGHADARAFFLYGAMDEVLKACTASLRWAGFLGDTDGEADEPSKDTEGTPAVADDDPRRPHFDRLILQAVIDEQQMWVRKLTELLADLIQFQGTNDQEHYRLYLAARQLDAYLGLQKDFHDFFACGNLNASASIEFLLGEIARIGRPMVAKAWFIEGPTNAKKAPSPGRVFRSARTRFKQALHKAGPGQRLALGVSYERGHAMPSRSIHLNIGGPTREVALTEVDRNINGVGVLCCQIVAVAYRLAGVEPEATAKAIATAVSDDGEATALLRRMYQPVFDIGDVVFAYGDDVCQVVDRADSEFGYVSYRVRYLTAPMLPEVPEDWFPANYVRLLYPREHLRQGMIARLHGVGASPNDVAIVESMPAEELSALLARSFRDMDEHGLIALMIEDMRQRPREPTGNRPNVQASGASD